jgi:hypothetical protein
MGTPALARAIALMNLRRGVSMCMAASRFWLLAYRSTGVVICEFSVGCNCVNPEPTPLPFQQAAFDPPQTSRKREPQTRADDGHLIGCEGFTDKGNVVTNDPGLSVRRNVRARRVYLREKVANAWKKSKNAAHLIYPETAKVPVNRSRHWD